MTRVTCVCIPLVKPQSVLPHRMSRWHHPLRSGADDRWIEFLNQTGGDIVRGVTVSGRRRGRHAGVFTGLALVMTLGGCGEDSPEDLPSFSASPSVSATPDAKAAVEAAYRGYQKATEEIAASGSPIPATLRPYATAERAQRTAEDLSILIEQGFRIVGTQKIDVRSVTIDGSKAVLEACVDATKWITVKKDQTPAPGRRARLLTSPASTSSSRTARGWSAVRRTVGNAEPGTTHPPRPTAAASAPVSADGGRPAPSGGTGPGRGLRSLLGLGPAEADLPLPEARQHAAG